MLHLSSMLFATVVIRAFYAGDAVLHHFVLTLTLLSVAAHTGRDCTHAVPFWPAIHLADRVLAHAMFVFLMWRGLSSQAETRALATLVLGALALAVWLMEHVAREVATQRALHMLVHLIALLTMHMHVAVRQQAAA